jgi:hypothetical protein
MIDPAKVCFYIPPGLQKFKLDLFTRVGKKIKALGGSYVHGQIESFRALPADIVPIVGCQPESAPLIREWRASGRKWIYWDRGYARRVFATWLPKGENGGFYRWHVGSFQLRDIGKHPSDRWKALKIDVEPWAKGGRHIVVAAPSRTYSRVHGTEGWISDTIDALARVTDRQLVIRDKESKRPLHLDLKDAHCLVTHASIAAVEAVVMGCPVFVHEESAAALVGRTTLKAIEAPYYPDRQPWLNALAYSQFDENELVDGTLWKLLGE